MAERRRGVPSVSPATAHRWKRRWLSASAERASGAWARDRSSRPQRSPRRTPREVERRVCAARERTGWGPRLIAGETGVAHSTVHAILKRHGCSRAPRPARERSVATSGHVPGDLLHMDVKRYPRFRRPGHAVTGDRRDKRQRRNPLGHDYFHAVVDDHTRLAYGELLGDEQPAPSPPLPTRIGLVRRPGHHARRLMTDGAMSYRHNRALRALLAERGIRHIITPPYTPRWNGKVERFHQTMEREWAKGLRYRNSTARNRALPHWLQPLQRAQTPQLPRRPTPDQPRSQPPRAGHLARDLEVQGRGGTRLVLRLQLAAAA